MAYPEPLSNWVISRVELFPGDDLRRPEQIVECDVGLLNGVEGPKRHRYEFRFQNENQGVRPQFTVIRRHPGYGTTREEECISRCSLPPSVQPSKTTPPSISFPNGTLPQPLATPRSAKFPTIGRSMGNWATSARCLHPE